MKGSVAPKKLPTASPKEEQGAAMQRALKFVELYHVCGNVTEAAKGAGFSPKSASAQGSRLLKTAKVQAALASLRGKSAEAAAIDVAEVLRRMVEVVDTDPNELVELRRRCCRYCYGEGHEYQWTEREFQRAQEKHKEKMLDWEELDAEWRKKHPRREPKPPEIMGGLGFDPRLDPDPNCPECFGEGKEDVILKDSRKLSPNARRALAGIEHTPSGVRVKMHDRGAMLLKIGEHLGMFVKKVEHGGSIGGASAIRMTALDEAL